MPHLCVESAAVYHGACSSRDFSRPKWLGLAPRGISPRRNRAGLAALVARLEQKLGRAKAVQSDLAEKEAGREAQGTAYEVALAGEAAAKKAEAKAKKARKAAEAEAKKARGAPRVGMRRRGREKLVGHNRTPGRLRSRFGSLAPG
jgi:hypothetical protein